MQLITTKLEVKPPSITRHVTDVFQTTGNHRMASTHTLLSYPQMHTFLVRIFETICPSHLQITNCPLLQNWWHQASQLSGGHIVCSCH